jgi:hypothetical protein
MAGAAGLAALTLLPAMSLASADHSPMGANDGARGAVDEMQLAHMSGPAGGRGMMGPGQGDTAQPSRKGRAGQAMGSGGMHSGMMGSGMMGSGMMGRGGMMGHGMMGGAMMGPGSYGAPDDADRVVPGKDLTVDDVRHFLDHRLEMGGNKRLKLGDVKAADDDRIIADITTVDGSLVERLEVDRHSGEMHAVE